MKIKSRLIALAILPALMPNSAYTEEVQTEPAIPSTPVATPSNQPQAQDEEVTMSKRLWMRAQQYLREAKLQTGVNLPTTQLANGNANISGGYQIESSPGVAGNYSGIDIWDLNISANSQLIGLTPPGGIGIGATYSRRVTYIQQFKKRRDSLIRVPYDPVTKLPRTSDVFFKPVKNIFTGKEEIALKKGDFIGYSAPLTLAIGKGFSQLQTHLGLSAGLSYAISGNFDIHVFVMDNNMVRVKIFLSKGNSAGLSVGFSLLGFDGLGRIIISRFIDPNILQGYISKNETDLFVADYIYNLNLPEGRELYDISVGSKLHAFTLKNLIEQTKAASPFSNGVDIKTIIPSIDNLNDVALADQNKPHNEKRILKLLNADNNSKINSTGIRLNLSIVKGDSTKSKTNSKITLYARDKNSVKARYKLDSYSTNSSFEYFIWGDRTTRSNSLLSETNQDGHAIDFVGMQSSIVDQQNFLKKAELDNILTRFRKILPLSISSKLKNPDWNFSEDGSVKNAYIQQDITFKNDIFELPLNINEDRIRIAILKILKHYGKFDSRPIGANQSSEDPIMAAFNSRDYAKAYGYEIETLWNDEKRVHITNEMHIIPLKLSIALNKNYSYQERFEAFDYLYEKVPLFSEISALLLTRIIPEEDLKKVVVIKVAMSANDQKSLIATFPEDDSYNASSLFREVLAQNGYINDKSYNLRNFIKENGELYSIDELLIDKK